MARAARKASIENRTARAKLRARKAPYFVKIAKGLHLGYYRGSGASGTWTGRRYLETRVYDTTTIGIADDNTDADGRKLLDYWQAQEAVRRWAAKGRLSDDGVKRSGPYTVRHAIEDYLEAIRAEKRPRAVKGAEYIFNASVLPALGEVVVEKLTADRITKWRNALAAAPRTVRSKMSATAPATKPVADTDDARRKRKATANRILTMLKAALNRGFSAGQIHSDQAWRRVKPFRETDEAVVRCLSGDEVRRLANACPADFRKMVQAALVTACRYSELARLKCGDFNPDSETISVRETKRGKPRHVVLSEEAREMFVGWTAGRSKSQAVFLRDDGKPWGASHQQRPLEQAAKVAAITPAPTFHVLRHTYASMLAMQGVPMGVIAAQLGHADTRMTEKHYAHLAPSYVAATIKQHFPRLGIGDDSNVLSIAGGK